MKRTRWPFWAALGIGVVAWLIAGFTVPQTIDLNDVFNGCALAAFGMALAFIIIYTVAGLTGPTKWWHTNVGSYIVLAAVSVLFIVGPTAFAVLFHHGTIDTWWWAWAWIGGHFLAAVTWGLIGSLWLRETLHGNGQGPPGHPN